MKSKPFFQTPQVELFLGDCLEVMPQLESQSFDAIVTDLPYGTTACSWDVVIPFEPLWEQYKRLIKPGGAIVLFASQPFTSELVMSNRKWFKYCWVWNKISSSGAFRCNVAPLKQHEDICVFSQGRHTYNPAMRSGLLRKKGGGKRSDIYSQAERTASVNDSYYPTSIISFTAADVINKQHPTQKPIALLQYLIQTYTNPGDKILDSTCGSGTTLVAARDTGRNAVGIELDPNYCRIAADRCQQLTIFSAQEETA